MNPGESCCSGCMMMFCCGYCLFGIVGAIFGNSTRSEIKSRYGITQVQNHNSNVDAERLPNGSRIRFTWQRRAILSISTVALNIYVTRHKHNKHTTYNLFKLLNILQGDTCGGFGEWWCCPCLSVAQERKEVRLRGPPKRGGNNNNGSGMNICYY